ncbi:GntR family transcriptional regulator [Cetobacterium sp.]|uniref:GntR family transcriptional regulator n=1 Tax=Cetobacterium sp. TaxID=2071632 RepID=UPI0025BD3DC6|nr:GntR family transcriptional regulator [Cetobacterium sp.]
MKLYEIYQNEKSNLRALNTLKRNILEAEIQPGEVIKEEFIKNFFNISRTLCRETIIKLEKENLLKVIPQKGTYVTKINLKKIEEFLFMRKTIEEKVLTLAISKNNQNLLDKLFLNLSQQKALIKINNSSLELINLDNEFHKIIFEECDLLYVWEMLQTFQTQYDRLRILGLKNGLTKQIMLEHHIEIYECFINKDQNKINNLLNAHLGDLRVLYKEIIINNLNFFEKI